VSDRRLALSFGRVAELYDRVRPDYSQASLDRAQAALELAADAVVIDLAAGTGRLTHELAKRFARVIAVEPDEAMRSLIRDARLSPAPRRRFLCLTGAWTRSSSARRSTGSRRPPP
jgi:ubiquinone/menaquinone biosynthesis C-methylase UbiE